MAEPRWLGAAVDIAEVYTILFANTWASADTYTLTINSKDIGLTLGAGNTATTDVATAVKEMINGDAATISTHTRSQTGNNVGEFARLTATASGSTLFPV